MKQREFVVSLEQFNGDLVDIIVFCSNRHEAEDVGSRLVDNRQYKSVGMVGEVFEL